MPMLLHEIRRATTVAMIGLSLRWNSARALRHQALAQRYRAALDSDLNRSKQLASVR